MEKTATTLRSLSASVAGDVVKSIRRVCFAHPLIVYHAMSLRYEQKNDLGLDEEFWPRVFGVEFSACQCSFHARWSSTVSTESAVHDHGVKWLDLTTFSVFRCDLGNGWLVSDRTAYMINFQHLPTASYPRVVCMTVETCSVHPKETEIILRSICHNVQFRARTHA